MKARNLFAKTTIVLFSGLALSESAAWAAPLGGWKGEVFRWDISEDAPALSWAIDTADADLLALVEEAFQRWENVDSAYVAFARVAELEDADIQVKVKDVLDNPYAAGLSYPEYGNGDATITSCELEVLGSVLESTSAETALHVFTHEIGHCLGLGHSVVEGAIMSYRSAGTALSEDDEMALTTRYPTGDAAYPVGCASPPLAAQRPSAPVPQVLASALGSTGLPFLLMAAGTFLPQAGNRRRKTPPLTAPRRRG